MTIFLARVFYWTECKTVSEYVVSQIYTYQNEHYKDTALQYFVKIRYTKI